MKVISTERLPIKMWLEDIEEGAMQQARNIANLPFSFRHIALMPDAHEGYGMPIGGVLATIETVIPNAVGVDIGCGMCAVQTSLQDLPLAMFKKIMNDIRKCIPLGFNHHKHKKDVTLMPDTSTIITNGIISQEYENAREQIGTLGGGNHFIEFQKDIHGTIWIMVHSGSRNLGHKVAEFYNKSARKLNDQWHTKLEKFYNLAFLPFDTPEAQNYLNEMQYCIDFAYANRMLMIQTIISVISDHLQVNFYDLHPINIAHNYVRLENHFNIDVLVHRKGATSARKGETGIIPGSQGNKSYIVRGKGNIESFTSCSHGAGRIMGRKQAQRELSLKKEIESLNKKGIIHAIRTIHDLDEAPGAYKDIDLVMKNQQDLVEIIVELSPMAVIKA